MAGVTGETRVTGEASGPPRAGTVPARAAMLKRVLVAPLDAFVRSRALKPAVFLLALTPLLSLVHLLLTGGLGANPIEELTHRTGELGLRFLLLGLLVTPLRFAIGRTWPVKLRRMLGLFAFLYVLLHVTVWSVLDQQLDLAAMWADLIERPYILAGFVGFAILVPLAATSTQRIARRMKRRWFALHRLVYIAAAAAVVHFAWLAKGDRVEPYVYLGILMALLLARFARLLKSA